MRNRVSIWTLLARWVVTPVWLIVVVSSTVFADSSFEDAVSAIKRGEYAAGVTMLLPLAEKGNVVAQYNIGVLYESGQGVEKDTGEAFKWFKKAAEGGHSSAQFVLASFYREGRGIEKSEDKALKWYKAAALQNNAAAQFLAGMMMSSADTAEKDYLQAHVWLRLAAEQLDSDNLRKLAIERRDELGEKLSFSEYLISRELAREWLYLKRRELSQRAAAHGG
jgi:TPR repeat protein